MAYAFQGVSIADINWGMITDIKVRPLGSGTLTSVGKFQNASISVAPLTMRGDPADTEIVYALRFIVDFTMLQSKTAAEMAMMSGTSGTGTYETDTEVAVVFASGRTITLGTVSTAPLRLVMSFKAGGDEDAQMISCHGENIEGISTIAAKLS